MIPVSLYGISVERCEEFFRQLPELVANLHDDRAYTDTLFAIDDGIAIEKLHRIDSWANFGPSSWVNFWRQSWPNFRNQSWSNFEIQVGSTERDQNWTSSCTNLKTKLPQLEI